MKKPIKSSYKTEAGYKRALKKYNDFVKANKTTKKQPAKKPAVKKPAAKKPAGKVPAKKPLISNKNKLRIKKAATTAKTTATKTAKTIAKKAGEAKKAVGKKVTATKKVLTKKGVTPRPKTPLQKLASGANQRLKAAGRYTKGPLAENIGKKSGKILKGIAEKGGLVRGIKNAGLSIGAERLTDAVQKRIAKATSKRGRNQTYKEFSSDFDKLRKERLVLPTAKRTLKGIGNVLTGKKYTKNNKTYAQKLNEEERAKRQNNQSSTSKNIKKQKTSKNNSLKISQRTKDLREAKRRVKKAKGYNKEKLQREVRYQEKFGKQGRTWSNPVGAKGKGKPSSVKTDTKSKPKKMHAIEKRNRERFGDAHVDRLKRQHEAFKRRRKKK